MWRAEGERRWQIVWRAERERLGARRDDVVRGNGKNQVSEKMENGPELYSRKNSE